MFSVQDILNKGLIILKDEPSKERLTVRGSIVSYEENSVQGPELWVGAMTNVK